MCRGVVLIPSLATGPLSLAQRAAVTRSLTIPSQLLLSLSIPTEVISRLFLSASLAIYRKYYDLHLHSSNAFGTGCICVDHMKDKS